MIQRYKKFPPLYKKTSTGALQVWNIETEDNVIVTRWGQAGGAIQEGRDTVADGKNAGRKNETTPTEQAEAEALSQWEKKKKKGYVEKQADAMAGKVDDVIEGGIFPMLAHKFSEQGHKIVYPALVQPKFDGHRCLIVVEGGRATMWTRTRKPITGLPHIIAAVETLSKESGIVDITLDGELYNHEYRDRFEELSSFIRTPEPKEGHEVVQYHSYDVANNEATQEERLDMLESFFGCADAYGSLEQGRLQQHELVRVETREVNDDDEMMLAFEDFLQQKYEGLMARNKKGLYVNKRSYDLQKVKEFDDAEFVVVGIEEGRGKLAGHAIFVCKTLAGVEFRAKMKGATEELKKYFDDPRLAIGKTLTIKYQGITNKSQVPRFPVALRFKEEV